MTFYQIIKKELIEAGLFKASDFEDRTSIAYSTIGQLIKEILHYKNYPKEKYNEYSILCDEFKKIVLKYI